MQLPHHVQQKVDDYLTKEVTKITDVAVLQLRKLLRINIWLAQNISFLRRQCNLDIDFVEFTLETFSLLHYLLESFTMGVFAKEVGYGNAKRGGCCSQTHSRTDSVRMEWSVFKSVVCFGHIRRSLLFHSSEMQYSKEAQVYT